MTEGPTPPPGGHRDLDDEEWQAARSAARDQVRAIFARDAGEAPLRRCPACGTETRTRWEHCPACGASFFVKPPRLSPRQRRLVTVALACAAVAAAALILPSLLRKGEESRSAAAQRHAALAIAEARRLRAEQRPHRGRPASLRPPAPGASPAARLRARKALVADVERAILRDARARVARGELDGPIRSAQCGPLQRAGRGKRITPDHEDLSKPIGRYDCIAVETDDVRAPGGEIIQLGYAFVAAVDFRTFAYVWCKNNPAPGERGAPLALVRLDRACLAARGRPIGTGYVLTPDD
jgi:hypothetical protein